MEEKQWFGSYRVVRTATSIKRASSLFPRERDNQLLRRHVLKLAFWPSGLDDDDDDGEAGADLDWDWITSLEKKRVGELRIDETIGGFNNLRVIFFKANICLPSEDMNRIWILTVFQKKSQGFGDPEIRAFAAARTLIVQRYYDGSTQA